MHCHRKMREEEENGLGIEQIRKLYEKIPSSKCKDGCFRCCINTVQFTKSEERAMGGYRYAGQCPHLKNGKCSVYENRPLVCRLFGASILLQCEDCTPRRYLTEQETAAILRAYAQQRKEEEAKKAL